jgi:hypothetical protein
MSVNRNRWGAKPYQLAFVTTVLVAGAKAKVDPYSSYPVHLDLDNETKREKNRCLLHFAWNFWQCAETTRLGSGPNERGLIDLVTTRRRLLLTDEPNYYNLLPARYAV